MLFHLLAWLTVLLLFALWSGLCAVAHAVLTWEGWRGSIDWQLALPKFELPDGLAQWLGLDWVEGLRAWLVEIANRDSTGHCGCTSMCTPGISPRAARHDNSTSCPRAARL